MKHGKCSTWWQRRVLIGSLVGLPRPRRMSPRWCRSTIRCIAGPGPFVVRRACVRSTHLGFHLLPGKPSWLVRRHAGGKCTILLHPLCCSGTRTFISQSILQSRLVLQNLDFQDLLSCISVILSRIVSVQVLSGLCSARAYLCIL